MLFSLPKILAGRIYHSEDGQLRLKEPYTLEEKKVLDEFVEYMREARKQMVLPLDEDDSDDI